MIRIKQRCCQNLNNSAGVAKLWMDGLVAVDYLKNTFQDGKLWYYCI